MILLLIAISISIHDVLRHYTPSNVIRDLVRTREGLKWGVPAMLLAVPYFGVAYWFTTIIDTGASKWIYLIVFLCLWSGIKMLWLGPISVVMLTRSRAQELAARCRNSTNEHDAENPRANSMGMPDYSRLARLCAFPKCHA